MKCRRVARKLGLYLDQRLSAEARNDVEAHLDTCARCREEWQELQALARSLSVRTGAPVPGHLWAAVAQRLDQPTPSPAPAIAVLPMRRFLTRRIALSASIALAAGLGWLGFWRVDERAATAQASTIDFATLLDELPGDANKAFADFLSSHRARSIAPSQAKDYAKGLRFEVPETLPGGFARQAVYAIEFGDKAAVAAEYGREGELVGAIFFPPDEKKEFGRHADSPCTIGCGRGVVVRVGDWKLVQVADKTTCHCLLTKLDQPSELLSVLARFAPGCYCSCGPDCKCGQ